MDKMLRNAYNLPYIQVVLPRACIIHAVRYPMDVALSCFAQPFEGRGLTWASRLDGARRPASSFPYRCCSTAQTELLFCNWQQCAQFSAKQGPEWQLQNSSDLQP